MSNLTPFVSRIQEPGMSQEEMDRVFDLFFTTKNSGLGMGMHIAYQIINAHQGTIEVRSEPSQGSTFRVNLPKGDGGLN